MKKTLLMLCITFAAFHSVEAQNDTGKIREFGIGLSSFNKFNIVYEGGTNKMLCRFSILSIGLSNSGNNVHDTNYGTNYTTTNSTETTPSISFALNFAVMSTKRITDRFDVVIGGNIGMGFSYANSTTKYNADSTIENSRTTFSPYIGMNIGARYALSSHVFIYAEIAPNIYYSYTNTSFTNSNDNNQSNKNAGHSTTNTYGISNFSYSGASIAIVYRFNKRKK